MSDVPRREAVGVPAGKSGIAPQKERLGWLSWKRMEKSSAVMETLRSGEKKDYMPWGIWTMFWDSCCRLFAQGVCNKLPPRRGIV